jgi:hypothetical protein
MKKFPDNIKHPKYHGGIIISCPECKAQIRIELNKPLKGDKIKKLIKSVERVYTAEEVQKEFDEKKVKK